MDDNFSSVLSQVFGSVVDSFKRLSAQFRFRVPFGVTPRSLCLIEENCNRIAADVHRVRTVDILDQAYHHDSHLDCILSLFDTRAAPMLKVFNVCAEAGRLPNGFLGGASNLQTLDIGNMSFSHPMPIVTLTKLRLTNVRGFTSVHQLLRMIEGASNNLEVLALDLLRSSFDLRVEAFDGRQIQLNSLKTLYLFVQPRVLMVILNHIRTPSDVACSINCSTALSQYNLNIAPLQSFLRNTRTGSHFSVNFTGIFFRMNFGQNRSSDYTMSLDIDFSETAESIRKLESLFANLDLSQVLSCDIGSEFMYVKASWKMFKSLLHHLGNLESLAVNCTNNHEVLRFITQLKPRVDILPCPKLNSLAIKSWVDTDRDIFRAELVDILLDRKILGHELRDLNINVPEGRDILKNLTLRALVLNVSIH